MPVPVFPERPGRDDAGYALFLVTGLAVALVAGIVLGALEPVLGARVIAAHARLQTFGFLGLVVAGMSLRLFPRLARRGPVSRGLTVAIYVAMVVGVGADVAGLAAGAWLLALGLGAVAATLGWRLLPPPRPLPGWWPPAAVAVGWWAATAVLTALGDGGAAERVLVLGASVSTVVAVQGRMVPVFFGRRRPGPVAILPGLALYTVGVAAGVFAPLAMIAAALGLAWLVLLTGAIRGRAARLTASASGAGEGILLANRIALLAALLMALSAPLGEGYADAALHVLALGTLSVLIVAMARLLAPVLAIERAIPGPARLAGAPPLLLGAAALLRGAASLIPGSGWLLLPLAGMAAWAGLAVFAAALVRAVVLYQQRRRALAVGGPGSAGTEVPRAPHPRV